MEFKILDRRGSTLLLTKSHFFLTWDDWDDFSFHTHFGAFYINEHSERIDLGNVKIGYFGQEGGHADRKLSVNQKFNQLENIFFSVGLDVEYYERLNKLGDSTRDSILKGLNDIAFDSDLYENASKENVFKSSFLRHISETTITGQFRRIAHGGVRLTKYNFEFTSTVNKNRPFSISFIVEPEITPPSNIHVLIGRNGVGKTFLINNMIESLITHENRNNIGLFILNTEEEEDHHFANLVCVSFSAFEEFKHPPENKDKSKGIQYAYIGLKKLTGSNEESRPKSPKELNDEFIISLKNCLYSLKNERWQKAISILESDPIFKSADISQLKNYLFPNELEKKANEIFKTLSSGHKIILLTITRLVECVQEKSLILFDEPESYLHPPLLSSFIRAVSDLLINQNGVGIIATHSPVILQEVPRSCVWKLRRNGEEAFAERLEIESFGENVGVLTHEVFGLEVTDSGFHKLLKELVEKYNSYNEVIKILDGQIGLEAKAILRSLFYLKNSENEIYS